MGLQLSTGNLHGIIKNVLSKNPLSLLIVSSRCQWIWCFIGAVSRSWISVPLFYSAKINNKSYKSDQLPWLPALFCQHISEFPVMLSPALECCFLLGSLFSLNCWLPAFLRNWTEWEMTHIVKLKMGANERGMNIFLFFHSGNFSLPILENPTDKFRYLDFFFSICFQVFHKLYLFHSLFWDTKMCLVSPCV